MKYNYKPPEYQPPKSPNWGTLKTRKTISPAFGGLGGKKQGGLGGKKTRGGAKKQGVENKYYVSFLHSIH